VFDSLELSTDPHLTSNGTFVEVDHPQRGTFTMPGFPIRMSDSQIAVSAAPLLGEHTDEVLHEVLGIETERLARLADTGITSPRIAAKEEVR
jgi:formyl-CoA transferase